MYYVDCTIGTPEEIYSAPLIRQLRYMGHSDSNGTVTEPRGRGFTILVGTAFKVDAFWLNPNHAFYRFLWIYDESRWAFIKPHATEETPLP